MLGGDRRISEPSTSRYRNTSIVIFAKRPGCNVDGEESCCGWILEKGLGLVPFWSEKVLKGDVSWSPGICHG